MRSLVPKLLAPIAVAVALLIPAGSALAAPSFTGKFTLAGSINANNKIVAGPDGNVWFTVSTAGKDVAKITPAGQITEYDLPGIEGPVGIAVGPEGKLWVPTVNQVTSFSPADPSGSAKTFTIATINAEGQIVAGPGGQMWVASNNNVTEFSPTDPEVGSKSFEPKGELSPKDIDLAGSLIVIADSGHKRLVPFNAAGEQGADIPLGGETTTAQGLAGNPDGQIAFSKSDGVEGLGLVTPPTAPTAALMPGDPFGVTLGADGADWFAMSAAHGVERLTTAGLPSALPFPGLEKWFPRQIAAGPGNTLWTTMEVPGENEYAIARVSGLEPPATPTPAPTPPPPNVFKPGTKLGKGPSGTVTTTKAKGTVKFAFSSTTSGATFQCALTRGSKTKKGKLHFAKPAFSACKSPKSYRVAPGTYCFRVRAVSAGGTDASPCLRKFRVVRTHK